MDILSIQPHAAELVLKNPGDMSKPAGVTLTVLPTTSDAATATRKRHQAEREALIKDGAKTVPDDVAERQGVETFACLVSAWTWADGLTLDGNANPKCTQENVVKLMTKADWALGQLVKFATRGENFYANFANGS
jgi:hypothetical protein